MEFARYRDSCSATSVIREPERDRLSPTNRRADDRSECNVLIITKHLINLQENLAPCIVSSGSRSLVHAPATHFLLTFVVHPNPDPFRKRLKSHLVSAAYEL